MKQIWYIFGICTIFMLCIPFASAYEYETYRLEAGQYDVIPIKFNQGDHGSIKLDNVEGKIDIIIVDEINYDLMKNNKEYAALFRQQEFLVNQSISWSHQAKTKGSIYVIMWNHQTNAIAYCRAVYNTVPNFVYIVIYCFIALIAGAMSLILVGNRFEKKEKIKIDFYQTRVRSNPKYQYGLWFSYFGEILIIIQALAYFFQLGLITSDNITYYVLIPLPAFLFVESFLYLFTRYHIRFFTGYFYFLLSLLFSVSLYFGAGWYFGMIFGLLGAILRIQTLGGMKQNGAN